MCSCRESTAPQLERRFQGAGKQKEEREAGQRSSQDSDFANKSTNGLVTAKGQKKENHRNTHTATRAVSGLLLGEITSCTCIERRWALAQKARLLPGLVQA